MKGELKPFVAACIIALCLGLGFGAIVMFSKAPNPHHHEFSENQRAAQNETPPNPPETAPLFSSIIAIFTENSLDAEAKYCGYAATNNYDKWLQNYRCGIHRSDVISLWFSFLLTVVTVGSLLVGYCQFRVYNRQRIIMDRQTDIFKRQLVAQRPILGYCMHKANVIAIKCGPAVGVDGIELSIILKNFGQSVASRAAYWLGEPSFHPYVGNAMEKVLVQDTFSSRIFRSEGAPGVDWVYPGGEVETDPKTISRTQLTSLHERKCHLFMWCVWRWGSEAELETFFYESALLLEFVLNIDPMNLTESTGNPAFRVAIRASRHRIGNDREQ